MPPQTGAYKIHHLASAGTCVDNSKRNNKIKTSYHYPIDSSIKTLPFSAPTRLLKCTKTRLSSKKLSLSKPKS